jgi:serine protease
MKKLVFSIFTLSLLVWACQKAEMHTEREPEKTDSVLAFEEKEIKEIGDMKPMPRYQIEEYIIKELKEKDDFRWSWSSDYIFWSATKAVKPQVAIGYKPLGIDNIDEQLGKIDLKSEQWRAVHDELIAFIKEQLGEKVNTDELIVEDDANLPRIVVNLDDYKTIAKLRSCQNVRYIEPLDFDLTSDDDSRSNSGCDGTAVTSLPTVDITTTTPNNCVIPWNYNLANIPAAWALAATSQSENGKNIKIGLIDAGISSTQPLLNASFASGSSYLSRTRTVEATLGTSGYTACTHGTSMCGLAAGPRNSVGATVGVAYNSNLRFVRAAEDVILDGGDEKTSVKNAFVLLGDDASVKVISMSMGTPLYSGTLEDGVNYAYNKGKLIFCAAGTSLSWTSWWGVIYPAKHDKCVAMTGTKENGSRCTVCHDGSEVDFTFTMERNVSSDRTSLSLHSAGNLPSYVGGSSCATAMGAGVAAMIWSSQPTLSRDGVLNILKQTSQYATPTGSKGYGQINAFKAIQKAKGVI